MVSFGSSLPPPNGNSPDDQPQMPRPYGRPTEWWLRGACSFSVSEMTCGVLMERYIPGFQVILGRSFQVPIGRSAAGYRLTADYYVEGALFEFHPPRRAGGWKNIGDFRTPEEQRTYYRNRLGLSGDDLHRYCAEIDNQLCRNYVERRSKQIASGDYRGTELIHAASPREFYDKVICRFSPNPPNLETFIREFHQVFESIWHHRLGRPPSVEQSGDDPIAA